MQTSFSTLITLCLAASAIAAPAHLFTKRQSVPAAFCDLAPGISIPGPATREFQQGFVPLPFPTNVPQPPHDVRESVCRNAGGELRDVLGPAVEKRQSEGLPAFCTFGTPIDTAGPVTRQFQQDCTSRGGTLRQECFRDGGRVFFANPFGRQLPRKQREEECRNNGGEMRDVLGPAVAKRQIEEPIAIYRTSSGIDSHGPVTREFEQVCEERGGMLRWECFADGKVVYFGSPFGPHLPDNLRDEQCRNSGGEMRDVLDSAVEKRQDDDMTDEGEDS
ncbi:hypothetical protein BZA05DRAFT_463992 [Tricharina praecox]|uniref:uncharacterized protein n=1 Tax=Tricharina praecox TaxID=43433 RepID=UPI002220F8E8|nr:uncharacterized protein BZA05DRAFT_463992 [Tricharina praecox]KAI5842227.1 hypothetical protein BZA05DRAFT_463992 [Tricharina praecox]